MASKIIERGVEGIPRNEILLENLLLDVPANTTRSTSTRLFRAIPGRKLCISFYITNSALVVYHHLIVKGYDSGKSEVEDIIKIDFKPGIEDRRAIEVEIPHRIVYIRLYAEARAPDTSVHAYVRDIVAYGPAIPQKKPFYERNSSFWGVFSDITVAAGTGWTDAWSYIVPNGRCVKIITYLCAVAVDSDIVNAIITIYNPDGVMQGQLGRGVLTYRFGDILENVLFPGWMIKGSYRNADTVDRRIIINILLLEFDQD